MNTEKNDSLARPPLQPPTVKPSALVKSPRTRSPAYPALRLEEAIEKAKQLYEIEELRFVGIEVLAEHWKMPVKASNFQLAIAALKQFGLLVDEGSKENRRVRVTDLAVDIVDAHPSDQTKRDKAIREAALNPKIHRELMDHFNGKLPPDNSIRYYLVRERTPIKFNKNQVDGFIAQFRATIAFAKLTESDILVGPEAGAAGDPCEKIAVGDLVQWTSAGVDQFSEPKQVLGFSEDREWAFVDGSKTGVLVSELKVKRAPAESATLKTPPANPHSVARPEPPPSPNWSVSQTGSPTQGWHDRLALDQKLTAVRMREFPLTLPSSLETAVLKVPMPMNKDDFKSLISQLGAMEKSLVRDDAGKSPDSIAAENATSQK